MPSQHLIFSQLRRYVLELDATHVSVFNSLMKFQKLYDAGVEMAFMADESRDRVQELQESVDIKLFAQLEGYDRRVDACKTLGLTFETEDYNSIANEEFYVLAATLEAEKARFDSLCESAAKTLTAAFAYEDVSGSFPTGKVLTAS